MMTSLDKFADSSSACAYFNSYTCQALCYHFPVSSPSPVKPYISTYTCEQISTGKALRDEYIKSKIRLRLDILRSIFNVFVNGYIAAMYDQDEFWYSGLWPTNIIPGKHMYSLAYPQHFAFAMFKRQARYV